MKNRRRLLQIILTAGFIVAVIQISSIIRESTNVGFAENSYNKIDSKPIGDLRNCTAKTHIMFLKTHKCASTTIQEMLFRFGLKRKLNFALPKKTRYVANMLGAMTTFKRQLIPSALMPECGKVDVFCQHTRLNVTAVKEVLFDDTFWFTIVREPASLYESMFHFFEMQRVYKSNLPTIMKKTIEELREIPRKFHGENHMMFDSGGDPKAVDIHVLNSKILQLEHQFDLVMIFEKLDESLILLKEKLCWDFEDIIVFKVNINKKKSNIDSFLYDKLREFNKADVAIYEFFYLKHEKEVDKFGHRRMVQEVTKLRKMSSEMKNYCDSVVGPSPKLEYIDLNVYRETQGRNVELCKLLIKSNLIMVDVVRNDQRERMEAEKIL